MAVLTFFLEQFALFCTKEYLFLPYLWVSKMLENGDGCGSKEYPTSGPLPGYGSLNGGQGKECLGQPPQEHCGHGEMSSGCVLLPETSPLGYAPHGLGQHDLKQGYAASPQTGQWFRKA